MELARAEFAGRQDEVVRIKLEMRKPNSLGWRNSRKPTS